MEVIVGIQLSFARFHKMRETNIHMYKYASVCVTVTVNRWPLTNIALCRFQDVLSLSLSLSSILFLSRVSLQTLKQLQFQLSSDFCWERSVVRVRVGVANKK